VGWGVGVYLVAVAVDRNVMVVPAQRGEVVRVVAAAVRESGDVVGLEAVAACTSVYDTCPVPECNRVSDGGWNRPGGWCGDNGYALGIEANDLDPSSGLPPRSWRVQLCGFGRF
jgi:hypothetical protein